MLKCSMLTLTTYFKVIEISEVSPILRNYRRFVQNIELFFSFQSAFTPLFASVCICASVSVVDSLNVLLCKDGNFPNLLLPRYTGKVFLGNPRQPSQINFLLARIKHYHHKNELAKRRDISGSNSSRTGLTILESIKTYFSSTCILVSFPLFHPPSLSNGTRKMFIPVFFFFVGQHDIFYIYCING